MVRGVKRLFYGYRKKSFGKQKISLYLRGQQKGFIILKRRLSIGVSLRQPLASSRTPLSMFPSDIQNVAPISRLPTGALCSRLQLMIKGVLLPSNVGKRMP